jgi:SAM-dependent methyltransferase
MQPRVNGRWTASSFFIIGPAQAVGCRRQSAITLQAHAAASDAKEKTRSRYGVASHLGIKLEEYDARIRTFIPDYEEMLAAAAGAIPCRSRRIVDLGTGTGALAERCLRQAPRARVLGIDADGEVLKLAERRLGKRARLLRSSFTGTSLPACDAVVASFALHHIRTRSGKARLYRRIRAALRPQGVFVSVDCQPAANTDLAKKQHEQWKAHLLSSYTQREATALLAAWAHEDTYVPLEAELELLRRSGLKPELLWRKGTFAVIMALR